MTRLVIKEEKKQNWEKRKNHKRGIKQREKIRRLTREEKAMLEWLGNWWPIAN